MYLLSGVGTDSPYWRIAIGMLVLGLGLGMVMQVTVLAVQNSVPPTMIGVATSSATFFRQVGGSFGTAIFGAILTSRLVTELALAVPPGSNVDPGKLTGSPAFIASLPEPLRSHVREAFVHSLTTVFLVAVPVCLVAFGFALFLKEQKLRTREDMMASKPEVAATEDTVDASV